MDNIFTKQNIVSIVSCLGLIAMNFGWIPSHKVAQLEAEAGKGYDTLVKCHQDLLQGANNVKDIIEIPKEDKKTTNLLEDKKYKDAG